MNEICTPVKIQQVRARQAEADLRRQALYWHRRRHGGDDTSTRGAAQLLAAQGQVCRLHRQVAGDSERGLGDGWVQASRRELPHGADGTSQGCSWKRELMWIDWFLAMAVEDLLPHLIPIST
jgi:hypothetical protein